MSNALLFQGDENAESHLLHSDDWMNSKGVAEDAKCDQLYFTLDGNTCLCYEPITPVGNDWNHVQRLFCRQLSQLGQTQELFQKWKFFQFDATDIIDSYALRLKQCAQILGYNEGQV